MARALPLYVTELFGLLRALGVPQKRCASALSLPRQVITNWASGGVSVPARHRASLVAFVEDVITEALTTATPDQYPQLCEQMHQYLRRWADENLERRGVFDRWYANLARELAQTLKTPLSTLTLEELQAAQALHLKAAHGIREAIQRRESPDTHPPLPPLDAALSPGEVLWIIAEHFHGEKLTTPALEARSYQQIVDSVTEHLANPSLPDGKRQFLETVKARSLEAISALLGQEAQDGD